MNLRKLDKSNCKVRQIKLSKDKNVGLLIVKQMIDNRKDKTIMKNRKTHKFMLLD